MDTVQLYTEVQQFYAAHMRKLDSGEIEAWADGFTPDATFSVPARPQPVRGREALVASIHKSHAHMVEAGDTLRHWHGMVDVREQPDGTVLARSYSIVIRTPPGGAPVYHRVGTCRDVLRRVGGDWYVAARDTTRDDM